MEQDQYFQKHGIKIKLTQLIASILACIICSPRTKKKNEKSSKNNHKASDGAGRDKVRTLI